MSSKIATVVCTTATAILVASSFNAYILMGPERIKKVKAELIDGFNMILELKKELSQYSDQSLLDNIPYSANQPDVLFLIDLTRTASKEQIQGFINRIQLIPDSFFMFWDKMSKTRIKRKIWSLVLRN